MPDMLDVAKYPTATYTGKLAKFVNGAPTEVDGTLTLHGVSKPVTLKIDHFGCRPHPMKQGKNVCGANANAQLDRSAFGVDWGKTYGFKMDVKLRFRSRRSGSNPSPSGRALAEDQSCVG